MPALALEILQLDRSLAAKGFDETSREAVLQLLVHRQDGEQLGRQGLHRAVNRAHLVDVHVAVGAVRRVAREGRG